MKEVVKIDGSYGEGGGQILRTSLALALITGRPIEIHSIRHGRSKPGLMRQHLTAVRAAAAIGGGQLEGDALGSTRLKFQPGTVSAGDYQFAVGTAGSVMLVFQTLLPPLLMLGGESTLVLEGGTHNPNAPCFDFLDAAFLPLIRRLGARVTMRLERAGYYPAGGGRVFAKIEPAGPLGSLELEERGEVRERRVIARVAGLTRGIAEREARVICEHLGLDRAEGVIEEQSRGWGPGNVVLVRVESEHVTEVFSGYGQKGVSAERVGDVVAREAANYLAHDVPVGTHLADQLLLPMALGQGGTFCTQEPTEHTRTNIEVIKKFLPVEVTLKEEEAGRWRLRMTKE